MAKRIEREKFSEEVEAHLARYLENREKRTGQQWVVTLRYTMPIIEDDYRFNWRRALIEDVRGVEVRIYYHPWKHCWVRA